jgi:hypothetical protein
MIDNRVTEILIPHLTEPSGVKRVRGTLLHSSVARLREHDYLERWRQFVGPTLASEIEQTLPGTWTDIAIAVAHYQACDRLGLGPREIDAIGQSVGDNLQNVLVSLGARAARTAGFDPKTGVRVFEKLFYRLFDGGSLQVLQTGPKDLVLELVGLRMTASSYFRTAYCGHLKTAAKFVGVRAVVVKPLRYDARSDTYAVSLAWV